ncbi:MTAP family purine nucleoside phosphorylase [Methanohalobium evestigatum]|nr:MTAP family purine nucleoside phosphorylase [Methanohalobium evestigatum]
MTTDMKDIMSSYQIQEQNTHNEKVDAVIIGGLAFSSLKNFQLNPVNTSFGKVDVYIGKIFDRNIAVIPRHSGEQNHVPPHRINYRANIQAVYELKAERIISVNSVGSMKDHIPGSFILFDDFLDFTKHRISTFFDNKTMHVDMSQPYCPQIKKRLSESLVCRGLNYFGGVYACTEGPRFETKAEINMLSHFADFVGMTGVPEIILAKELDICYASIGLVTNYACGLSSERLTVDEVMDVVNDSRNLLYDVISDTISRLPENRDCSCMYATYNARI